MYMSRGPHAHHSAQIAPGDATLKKEKKRKVKKRKRKNRTEHYQLVIFLR
jgi:hypothetical protein